MRITPTRAAVAALAVVAAATAATIALDSSAASAATSPITGGTTTILISQSLADQFSAQGLATPLPTQPASLIYAGATQSLQYSYPVTGGNASVNTFYGKTQQAGSLRLHDTNTATAVTFKSLVFNIQTDTVSATPVGTTTPVVLFDTLGQHTYNGSTQPETYSASDLQIDPAGADYIDTALGESVVTAGEHFGKFATSFTNTNG